MYTMFACVYNDNVAVLLKCARALYLARNPPALASTPINMPKPLPPSAYVAALLVLLASICVAAQAHAIDSAAIDSVVTPRLIRSGYFGIHQ